MIDEFYLRQEEPAKSVLLILRDIILDSSEFMTPEWKYGSPFFYYKKRMFAYVWVEKKTKHPYIGVARGGQIEHYLLEQGDRKRMKICRVDPNQDIPVEGIKEVLKLAMEMHDQA